ncbi:response regulator [Paenibacillus sp. 1011MAR3C5]|uniref:response regulator n=1 Tax=Paenibacillus sp. 1011MAR3C5 TaxID=1675787 RepID=UPI000E6D118E|nr:response regulator [Paenibacillus sp. 1011MAR3C5]RJE87478.1 response regulator [Paenibacillus sp. 1011MAR3C5]
MRALLVDDERLALQRMEWLIKQHAGGELEWSGAFLDPYDALEAAQAEQPDIAFLDIELPEMNGFELAERLLLIRPKIRIVFVTAYQDYAIKAFDINALDYLLKPVAADRLSITMQRAREAMVLSTQEVAVQESMTLCCFPSLYFRDGYGQARSFTWKTLKAEELFAYLIHRRGLTVNKQELLDLLWPDYDAKKATAQLHTAIYQIRKVIESAKLDLGIIYKDGGYRLTMGSLAVDIDLWESHVRELPPLSADTLELHLRLYTEQSADYLADHRYSWAEWERDRIRLVWLRQAKPIAVWYYRNGQYGDAATIYQHMLDRAPDMEDGYFGLMKTNAALNYSSEVMKLYHTVASRLREAFNVAPSRELTEWYDDWKRHAMTGD